MKVCIEFNWEDVGEVRLDSTAKLEFPRLSTRPGVYASRFIGQDRPTIYIGETENIQRRIAHYRNPGPSQQTNIRLNQKIRSHLRANDHVTVHLITRARLETDLGSCDLDLTSVFARRLLENATLVAEARSGKPVENL